MQEEYKDISIEKIYSDTATYSMHFFSLSLLYIKGGESEHRINI